MATHVLKAVSPWFEAVANDDKMFEVRYNDRDYQVGDILIIEHWGQVKGAEPGVLGVVPGSETLQRQVGYVYRGRGPGEVKVDLMPGFVVLGIWHIAVIG